MKEVEERERGGRDFTGARDGVLNKSSFLLDFCIQTIRLTHYQNTVSHIYNRP